MFQAARERRESAGPTWAAPGLVLGLVVGLVAGGFACGHADERSPTGPTAEGGPTVRRSPRPERIVLLSMDTVRGDLLVDPSPERFPNLHALATEGVTLPRFYAASTFTIPSHMSMFTGLDAQAHGIHDGANELEPDVPTLATRLGEAGYRTQAFHEGGYVGARYGFDRGFESYEELGRVALVGEALERVLGWVRAHAGEPWFLFLHTYAAHNPYGGYERYRSHDPERGLPSTEEVLALDARARAGEELTYEQRTALEVYNQLSEARGKRAESARNTLGPDFVRTPHFRRDLAAIRVNYAERIGRIDAALGRLRAELEALGQWEDTLVVVTADHGEAFFEHGVSWHGFVPYEELLHVPLFVSFPRALASVAGRRVEGIAWHLDLYPTLLELAGLGSELEREALVGRSLVPALLGEAELPAERSLFPLVLEVPVRRARPPRRAALRGARKFVEGHPQFGFEGDLLFDLGVDPRETRNLAAGAPDECDRWRAEIEAYAAALEKRWRPREGPEPELSAEERERLRALGYAE